MANLPQSPRVTEIFSAADIFSRLAAVSGAGLVSFSQEPAGAVARTVLDKLRDTVSVRDFGAVGDGVTDDYAAIQAALSNTPDGTGVFVPVGTYRISQGLTIPNFKRLYGETGAGAENYSATSIVADLAVPVVVTLPLFNGVSRSIANLGITRAAGTVPAGSIGVLVQSHYSQVENVQIYRQEIGLKGDGAFALELLRVNTTQVTKSHFWLHNSIQVIGYGVICGHNGGADVNCDQYIKISGTSDTIRFTDSQFNLAGFTATRAIYFDTHNAPNGVISFDTCHFENASCLVGQTGTTSVNRMSFTGNTINIVPNTFTGLPAGFFNQLVFANNPFVLGLTTFDSCTRSTIIGNNFTESVTLTALAKSVFLGNTCDINLTLNGAFSNGVVAFNPTTGSFADTATGTKTVGWNRPNEAASGVWAPAPTFTTPGDVGFVVTTQVGDYTINGRQITVNFDVLGTITHTTASGSLQLSGLPFPQATVTGLFSVGGAFWSGITKAGYTDIKAYVPSSSSVIRFSACGSGVTAGDVAFGDVPTGGTLRLVGTITYRWV